MESKSAKSKNKIYQNKIRCSVCYEVPIIQEILETKGVNCFITAECLNHHKVNLCPIKEFCSDKTKLDNIKCTDCNAMQGIVESEDKFFSFCKECNKFCCPKCFKLHYQKFKKTHHISSVDKIDNICKKHQGPFIAFCGKCNINLCPLCLQREHFDHTNVYQFDKIKPNEFEINDIYSRLDIQKGQIDIIYVNLDKLVKFVDKKVDEYKKNLNNAINFNLNVFNSLQDDRLNYQSIINFKKVLDIDITDIGFVKDIQEELEKVVKLIQRKSSNKILAGSKATSSNPSKNKELSDTISKTSESIKGSSISVDKLLEHNISKEWQEEMDFKGNELLKEIGIMNKRILKREDILGEIKKIYSIDELDIYLMVIDNGIFTYDKDSNDILNYIDINDCNLSEYHEINNLSYYYNNMDNLLYLFVGTNTNKIKIYTIDENDYFNFRLSQEIETQNLIYIFCNANNQLYIFEKKNISMYTYVEDKYIKEKDIDKTENELKKIYETENYIISSLEEKDTIIFYDKAQMNESFSINDTKIDEKSKIFEIYKKFICISFGCKIKVINIKEKKECFIYEKNNVNYVQSVDVINNRKILLSCNCPKKSQTKLVLFILEWDEINMNFREIKNIENLNCKMICRFKKNNAILYTKYGVNMIVIPN